MADNSLQNGTDTIRDKDRAAVKTQIFGVDTNIGGATEVLQTANALADATANPTVPGYAAFGHGWNGTTWDRLRSSSGALQVVAPDTTSSGSLAALNATVALPLNGSAGAAVQISGTWAGTVTFEGTLDNATWFPINAVSASTSQPQTTTTVNGLYRLTPGGLASIRSNMSAFTSGTATIGMRASAGAGGTFANQILPTKNTDGISSQAIKPASTAAVAGDQAAVVALHPSSPLPTGTNKVGTVDLATAAATGKGVQGANGVPTQDLKDAGRVNIAITCYQAAGVITTEALFAAATFSRSADGAAASTGQQFTVTGGKRFRLQSIVVCLKNTAAAAGTSKLVLRYAAAGGTITTASPILAVLDMGTNMTVAGAYIDPTEMALPDGVELLPASTFGFTNLAGAVTMLHTITLTGYEY